MPQCEACGKVVKTALGLRQHQATSNCGRAATLRRDAQIVHIDNETDTAARETKPLRFGKVALPSQLGGVGRKRRADNYVPREEPEGKLDYWSREEETRELDDNARQAVADMVDDPVAMPSVGDDVDSESEEEELWDNDHASAEQLRDSMLLLARAVSDKAGASLTNRVLRVILQENFPEAAKLLKSEGLDSVIKMTERVDKDVAEMMTERGFREVWVVNPENKNEGCCMYLRDAVEVVKRQLELASVAERNFYFQPWRAESRDSGEVMRTHPMSGDLAHAVLPHVRREVIHSKNKRAAWYDFVSFMCFLQVYSDKSAMGLSTKDHVFYPLHLAVMNLVGSLKDEVVRNGYTIVAYLSTSAKWLSIPEGAERIETVPCSEPEEDAAPREFMDTRNPNDVGQATRCMYRCSIAAAFSGIRDNAHTGVRFLDAENTKRRAHLVLAAISGDAPELHLATCTKNYGCPRCEISKNDLHIPMYVEENRTNEGTKEMLRNIRRLRGPAKTRARDEMWRRGYSTTEPAFLDWPFTLIPGLDIYSITRCDIMHAGPLGQLRHILTATYNRAHSNNLSTAVITNRNGVCLPLAKAKNTVLTACNEFLAEVTKESPAIGFSVNFARGKKKDVLDGLFTDIGIASMLQAKDYRMAQEVMPFVAALIDRNSWDGIGDNGPTAVLTKAFVLYQEMDMAIRRKDMPDVGFTDGDLRNLRKRIENLQRYVLVVLAEFQDSGFTVEKWHSFNHLIYDLAMLGLATGFDTSVFESAHPRYKAAHKSTARRHSSATADTTLVLARQECTRTKLDREAEESRSGEIVRALVHGTGRRGCAGTKSVRDAVVSDVAIFPANGKKMIWSRVHSIIQRMFAGAELKEALATYGKEESEIISLFMKQMGELCVAHKALNIIHKKAVVGASATGTGSGENASPDFQNMLLLSTVSLTLLQTVRLPGLSVPTLCDVDETAASVQVKDTGFRLMQRVVASAKFSHGKKQFQDSVMIEGTAATPTPRGDRTKFGDDGMVADADAELPRPVDIWFAKVLAFVKLKDGPRPLLEEDTVEFAIVRYYDVVPRSELDDIDVTLGCVKLRWAMDVTSIGETESAQPWIDVIPASSIRGRLHVVREPPRELELDYHRAHGLREGRHASEWTNDMFYVNRFKVSDYAATYFTTDIAENCHATAAEIPT